MVYAHPLFMAALLALGLWILSEGLRIRRGRLLAQPFDSRRHRRVARWFVVLVTLGSAAGLASMIWLRDEPPLQSVHFAIALPALLAFICAGILGLRLERRGGLALRNAHALLGAGGLLLGLAAAVAGFAILP